MVITKGNEGIGKINLKYCEWLLMSGRGFILKLITKYGIYNNKQILEMHVKQNLLCNYIILITKYRKIFIYVRVFEDEVCGYIGV